MSLLPPEIHTALQELLQALQAADNTIRSQAEEKLNGEWMQKPSILLMGLVEISLSAPTPLGRSFAAVIFRRIAVKGTKDTSGENKETYTNLAPMERIAIRQKLLDSFAAEADNSVRHKIEDAIAEVARQHSENDESWPELLALLFEASQSKDENRREGAFRIIATTPAIIEGQGDSIILEVFKQGFQDADIKVRLAAMDAFANFFQSLTKKQQQKFFPIIQDLLNILPPLQAEKNSDDLSRALISLIDLAENSPKMFRPLFNHLVKFNVSVIQDKDLSDQTRQNALELMATFADYAPQMCKKDPDYTNDMVTQCLSLMTDIGVDDDDAAEWKKAEDLDQEENDLNHVAGEQCMDRLANKLGGGAILEPAFRWLPRMIESTAWRDRHAALMAISAISEGCRDLMLGGLAKVLDMVIPLLRDPHPRVQWAACNALGQMSTDFAGTMQEQFHAIILPNIITVLESPEPRVQSHAAAALVNFCEEAEKTVLEPYLENLLDHLLRLLQSPMRFVKEQALSTIATIADSAEQAFGRYYDVLMPILFSLLQDENLKEYRLLRAKAMECATLIALAVGKDKLGQDAFSLVQVLGSIQQNIVDADDPQAQYLLHCWGRMCRVMGRDFLPYLQAVMPPLLEMASARADIQLLEDDERVAQMEQEEGWELVPLKGKVIGIKTATLDDKNMAIELLCVYANVLLEAFEPYVVEIMDKIALPGLTFFFHDVVRVSSTKLVPHLLTSFKLVHQRDEAMAQLWERTITKVIEAVQAEPQIETLSEMYQCFYESVETMGKDCLTEKQMAAFIEAARGALEEYQQRVAARAADRLENDGDEEEDEELQFAIDDDQTLLSDMNKAFHTIFKNHGAAFLPSWEQLMPFYLDFIKSEEATQRQWALCIMDDVVEFCGETSWNYSQQIIQPLIDGLRDDIPANRQAAAYGVGVAALKGGGAWSEFVAAAIPELFNVTRRPDARLDDHVYATENACASIAKILHNNASKLTDVNAIIASWIDTLPIVHDEEAAPFAYSFLAYLITQSNPAVLSEPQKVFTAIAQALKEESIAGQTLTRVVNAGKQLLQVSGVDPNTILASMTPDLQEVVRTKFA